MNAPDDPTQQVVPGEGFAYYRGRYWNDLPEVVRRLNERATGDPALEWYEHLRDGWGPFERALIVNCGNGWVERELAARGVIRSAVGVDVSSELLDQARREAAERGFDLRYEQVDTNRAEFPAGPFDLVVNHAALHHVAYLDRVVRTLCRLLGPDGVFVSWDYVGPHRNQYPAATWEAAWQVNQALPDAVRQDLVYPHLPTMLADDPTEAVHSELVLPTLRRYLRIAHERPLGGAIAYPILTHNDGLHGCPDEATVDAAVRTVMDADAELTDRDPSTTLFAYVVGRPDVDVLGDEAQLAAWTTEEDDREAAAVRADARYYPSTAVGAVSEALVDANDRYEAKPDRATVLATTPGREMVRILRDRLVQRVRSRIPTRR